MNDIVSYSQTSQDLFVLYCSKFKKMEHILKLVHRNLNLVTIHIY